MKLAQGIRPCGAFIFHIWSNFSKNFSFGGPIPLPLHRWGWNLGAEEWTFGSILRAKFHPHRCSVSPLRGEKTQNRPLSNLNNQRFALRANLPVNYFDHLLLLLRVVIVTEVDWQVSRLLLLLLLAVVVVSCAAPRTDASSWLYRSCDCSDSTRYST